MSNCEDSPTAGQGAPRTPAPRHLFIPCPVWQLPLFDVTVDGLEIKCRRCHGTIHRVSRAILEQIWEALSAGRDPFAERPG